MTDSINDIVLEPEDLRPDAESIVKSHAMVAMAGGLVPVPALDIALLVANQVKMVQSLTQLYDVPFETTQTHSIILGLLGGSAPVFGVMGLSALKIIPGIGTLVGSSGVSVSAGALTYAVGRVFIHHFESGNETLELDISAMRRVFRREMNKAKQDAAQDASDTAKG